MRNPSLSVIERNGSVLARIRRIKEEHPFWGYRRVWAWLRYKERVLVNKKRVLRLMQVSGLTLKPHEVGEANERLRAKRLPERPKPRPTRPKEWWGIDMTKVLTPSGWVYIVLVLDWYTKRIVGHMRVQGPYPKTGWKPWIGPSRSSSPRQRDGVKPQPDNGSQPTSVAFVKACGLLGINKALRELLEPQGKCRYRHEVGEAKGHEDAQRRAGPYKGMEEPRGAY